MLSRSEAVRLAAAILLLAVAMGGTWQTITGVAARRLVRMQLAEIGHVRYGLLNADRWVEQMAPILDAKIDAIDLQAANASNLRPIVENALYVLLDDVKTKMSAGNSQAAGGGGFMSAGNPFIVNMIVGALRPHVPEYAKVVLAELGKPEAKDGVKKYLKGVLADGVRGTLGAVDMTTYSSILREHGCADGGACKEKLSNLLRQADTKIQYFYVAALASSALAFVLLLPGGPVLRRPSTVVLLLFCVVLLLGGVLTPMIEVEAKVTPLKLTFLGEPMRFGDQVLYFQSKSVLEVFRLLVTTGKVDMWIVGVLVLMFSVVFPILKILASALYLYRPALLRENPVVRFFALESSKWSMADVMALAIFMSFVAFNGLIANTMRDLKDSGVLALPTDGSKILPGYHLFIGFCLASLFLSRKLARGIRATANTMDRTVET